ncbi:hypothetical protein PTTG_26216 [Puccinia triticina 1-1 BBBD Race 1]|uniref:Uncharacterized protein n=2 Tax=Puccinia triticina TaxID=208348 RepID=A0A180GW83_PUCT1|nr:uncharacterized protein PtA15_6A248 [Puccinia triticina]OAV97020.1 hypothetical protein PTTG_26216 [Puccinia triticina 1-1 BBBD Race 1]WAQ85620.1 hypothetical protein PtA15_6A248 [Puccinia triticina]WAR55499.1 hypothetical protein PtB15_6B240 [Puccinia triticina]
MASEIVNYPGHSILQPMLTGRDIESSQASPFVLWPDLRADTRRIDGGVRSRKRIKTSHEHLFSLEETTSCSTLKSGPSDDHGKFKLARNGPSSSGKSGINEGQIPTQDEVFMLLDKLEVSQTGHLPQNAQPGADPPTISSAVRSPNKIPVIEKYCQAMSEKLRLNSYQAA